MLKKQFEPRRYQETIFAQATLHNTLVVLPTGLGKTMIAIMLATHRLQQYPEGKVLILAPTKPLVQQHERSFKDFIDLPDEEVVTFTGAIRPEKRQQQWEGARLIFSTPQGLENDVISGRISFKDVVLIVFDEAHRTVGDYSYVFLASRYFAQAQAQRILALTASPGTDEQSIFEVCEHLNIEEIEVRSSEDSDVSPYVQELEIEWVRVQLPKELLEVRKLLTSMFEGRIAALKDVVEIKENYVNKRTLLAMQGQLQARIAKERDMEAMKAVSINAEALKIQHALELLDTQGLYALQQYFSTMDEQARKGQSKAVQRVVVDPLWKVARVRTDRLREQEIEHPKMRELRKVVHKHRFAQKDLKVIIFTQYRDQAVQIKRSLESVSVTAEVFVGQQKKGGTGMSQKEQKAMLDRFRAGEFTALIATSVAEEGLDIPKVDLVIFYEPVPSAIRTVQRRGRTGRGEKGKVIVFMTEGTADVGYKWAAHHKEKRMYRAIESVKKKFKFNDQKEHKQQRIVDYTEKIEGIKIVGDYREKASAVMKELIASGVQLELAQLAVGDYQLSDRVAIEYKHVPDFVDSMLDGRLLEQLKSLRQYPRAVILIEGEQDIYSIRKVHPNAIMGMLSTIAISYNIPILWAKNAKESAGLILTIARREQEGGKEFQRHSQKPVTDDELQEYIVAAFPGVGTQLARPLLEEFKSIKNLVNASEDQLKNVPLIGEKKAKRIKEVSEREWKSER